MGILKSVDAEYRFFSVKKSLTFGSKTYRPSVCYPLTADIYETVVQLAEEGNAVLYTDRVRFVSGKSYVVENVVEDAPILVAPTATVQVAAAETTTEAASSSSASSGIGEFSSEKA